ncbi:hypothetical protein AX16_007418 [Volvariella volvacea WC 439]|nr:hypothetical protein AX16_007418 [Volvariella volvacea WC 439]
MSTATATASIATAPNHRPAGDTKRSVTPSNSKLAMSRALGAAFLNHQVEQMEKSVAASGGHRHNHRGPNGKSGGFGGARAVYDGYGGGGAGGNSGNWRDRRQTPVHQSHLTTQGAHAKRAQQHQPAIGNKAGGVEGGRGRKVSDGDADENRSASTRVEEREPHKDVGHGNRRRSTGEDNQQYGRDADIVVVDASVLVNALYQVKKWCREGRDEIIIVPLEALNTLDLLKKGTSPLAQRARAASRLLEAQVGSNPRIRVQQDDAFVLWDKISFKDLSSDKHDSDKDVATSPARPASYGSSLPGIHYPSPEWVRRTICCACWEVENAPTTINGASNTNIKSLESKKALKVVLAVLSEPPSISPKNGAMKLKDEALMNPVPLPIPAHGKNEPRTSGVLVSHWAARAGVELFEVDPTAPPSVVHGKFGGAGGFGEEEVGFGADNRSKRSFTHSPSHGASPRGRRPSYGGHDNGHPRGGLVERPPAVMAMMEMVSQPKKVIKVLARGEKLEPDP